MSFKTKVSLLFLTLFIGAGVLGANVAPAEATSLAELQQYIEQLKTQIAELQAKLKLAQAQQPTEFCHTFNRNLKYGDVCQGSGNDCEILQLQNALKKEGFQDAYKDNANASGGIAIFAEHTASAVVGFQEKYKKEILSQYGLNHGTGFVGKSTRAKLNQLYGCGVSIQPITPIIPITPVMPEPIEPISPVQPDTRCSDSDGGIRKYVQGKTCRNFYSSISSSSGLTTGAGSAAQFCRTDQCVASPGNVSPLKRNLKENIKNYLNKNYVREYYCKNGKIFSKAIYCENGCINGACRRHISEEPTPSIVVKYPNGGEMWEANTTQIIRWNATSDVKTVRVVLWAASDKDYLKNSVSTAMDSFVLSQKEYAPRGYMRWTIDSEELGLDFSKHKYFSITLEGYSVSPGDMPEVGWGSHLVDTDRSDDYFSIVEEQQEESSITIISPNGGEEWSIGEERNITWESNGVDKVGIYAINYSCTSEMQKMLATEFPSFRESYSWTIPDDFFESMADAYCPLSPFRDKGWVSGDNFKIFIAELKSDGVYGAQDESDDYFSIIE